MTLKEYPSLILMRCIEGAQIDSVKNAIAIGNALFSIKATIPYGSWLDFIKSNFELSIRTCQDYMYLAKNPIQESYYKLGTKKITVMLREGEDLSV